MVVAGLTTKALTEELLRLTEELLRLKEELKLKEEVIEVSEGLQLSVSLESVLAGHEDKVFGLRWQRSPSR